MEEWQEGRFLLSWDHTRLKVRRLKVVAEGNKLRRQDGIVGGVCGGLGAFFGINPFWFRLLFVILLLPGGLPGLVPYLILWLVIPAKE
jgi:phage shock protein C